MMNVAEGFGLQAAVGGGGSGREAQSVWRREFLSRPRRALLQTACHEYGAAQLLFPAGCRLGGACMR